MSNYKLTYFNMRGRAESARWIFAYANQKYEDDRIDEDTEWPTKKLEIPYGKIPTLYVDGESLYSSSVICRYLGKVFNLMPEDKFRQAVCDEVVDGINDCLMSAKEIIYAKKAGKVEEVQSLSREFLKNVFPPIGKALENRLQNNEWFGGSKVSWADFYVAYLIHVMASTDMDLYSAHPKLQALVAKVMELPAIAKWIKERPQTQM